MLKLETASRFTLRAFPDTGVRFRSVRRLESFIEAKVNS